jgi:hypothetical protein
MHKKKDLKFCLKIETNLSIQQQQQQKITISI